jgi:hypothetical protein
MPQTVTVFSHNPYHYLYPDRKVITREQLDFVKKLRSEGFDVIIEPKSMDKLYFITKKGEWDFLKDFFVIEVSQAIRPVIYSLISAWIFAKRMSKGIKTSESNICIKSNNVNGVEYFSHDGNPIAKEKLNNISGKPDLTAHPPRLLRPQPSEEFNWPIFYNHTSQHVGWGKVWETDKGLETSAKIFDAHIFERIQSGNLRGMSITGIVNKSNCMICNNDYTLCNHIGQQSYDGAICSVSLDEIDLCELHIVEHPVNPLAQIEYIEKL